MDSWLPGIPRYPNVPIVNPANLLIPRGVVTHRTIGNWAGDLSVLTRARVPSCHYLVGKAEGQWGQLVPNGVVANHAAGANSWAIGIEVSGQNGEPMTDWQITACRRIVNWLVGNGIPKDRYRGTARVTSFAGFIDHAFIATEPRYEHYDYWNPRDWDMIASGTPAPPPEPRRAPMATSFMLGNQLQGVWVDAKGRPKHEFYDPNSKTWVGPTDMAPDHPEFKLDANLPLSVQTVETKAPNLVDVMGRGEDGSLVHMFTNPAKPWRSERFG